MNDMLGKMRDLLKPWMKGTSPLEIRRAMSAWRQRGHVVTR